MCSGSRRLTHWGGSGGRGKGGVNRSFQIIHHIKSALANDLASSPWADITREGLTILHYLPHPMYMCLHVPLVKA